MIGEHYFPEPNVKVRLRGGLYETKGRVEIQAFGIWGTICMNGFGVEEVKVICRQLGYPGYVRKPFASCLSQNLC